MCRLFFKNKKGFTLVELMVVVLILGLLTAIGIPSYRGAKKYAERRIVETNLRMIDAAIEVYNEVDNSVPLTPYNLWERLVPDYIHAEIEGPGTAKYRVLDGDYSRAQVYTELGDNVGVGGHPLGLKSYYHIGNLPWNQQ